MSQYWIRGGDGNEYGPASEDMLRQWIAQGRANNNTPVRGTDGQWKTIGDLPGFSTDEAGSKPQLQTRPQPAPQPAQSQAMGGSVNEMLAANVGRPARGSNQELVQELAARFAGAHFWLKFLAVLQFAYAALYVVVSFGLGLVFAWIPIWLSILMWKAANRNKEALMTGNAGSLSDALGSLKTIAMLIGILTMVGIILTIGMILLMLVIGVGAAEGGSFQEMLQEFLEGLEQQQGGM